MADIDRTTLAKAVRDPRRGILRSGPFQSFCADRRMPFATFQNLGIAWPELEASARERAA